MKGVLLFLCASWLVVPSAVAADQKVRLYVFTAPAAAGLVDQESKRRADSVHDVLADLKYQKNVATVESAADADAIVELVSSASEPTGATSTSTSRLPGGPALSSTEANLRATVRVRVRVPRLDYSTEMVGQEFLWRDAAASITRQLGRWAKENAARLTTR